MQLLQEHIHDELDALQGELATASPQEILRFAADRFGEGLAVVTSFQPTGIVTLHMLQEIAPRTTVITLDTGFLFPQTLQLIDELEARFDLNLAARASAVERCAAGPRPRPGALGAQSGSLLSSTQGVATEAGLAWP